MTKAFDCAVRLLARREHGAHELAGKLIQKGYSQEDTENAIVECQRHGWQSDSRFVEAVFNTRIRQGYGPLRISQELQNKYICRELITAKLDEYEEQWQEHAHAVWQKKFMPPENFIDMQKQQRFLLYRGFPIEIIAQLFKNRQR